MNKKCDSIKNCTEQKRDLFTKNGFVIKECETCLLRFTDNSNHIEETYSDKYFFEGKEGYPNYLEEKKLLIKSGLNYAKIISRYAKPGTLLDVGCAAGFILKGFEMSGWDCHGVEPNDTMAKYGRDQLNLDIKTGGMETFDTDLKFDLINLIEVVGSFYDTDEALKNISALCKKAGLVLVESWDMHSFTARLFGKSWHEYCPPTVVNWFSDETLTELFNYYGFSIIAKGRPLKRISLKHGFSVVAVNTPAFKLKGKILRFLNNKFGNTTVLYPPLDVKWYLFKKW